MCTYNGEDNLQHIQVCPFYYTKWKKEFNDTEDKMAEYILMINRERLNRVKMPIL